MPREGHGSRNALVYELDSRKEWSCPARGMGVEIGVGCVGKSKRNVHCYAKIRSKGRLDVQKLQDEA